MEDDNASRQEHEALMAASSQVRVMLQESCRHLQPVSKRPVGKPPRVTGPHLCLGILYCFLQGWKVQLDLWRLIRGGMMEPFAPVDVTDQAIYNRLARAGGAMRAFFEQVSSWIGSQPEPWQDRSLAPFANQILALDECTLDQVARWLPSLRSLGKGDAKLLAGRLSALFDIRLQQWIRVDLLEQGKANCKAHVSEMLGQVQAGCLLLFDRGYFSFAWFDELTQQGIWWVSRYANKASFRVEHIIYQGDGVLDAIIRLGVYRSDQAKQVVRLIRFWHQGKAYCYLTNVLDAHQLSLQDVVNLYGRRWDIELAFRLLKEYLQLNEIWSAKWGVVQVQVWGGLVLAQLFHAVQMQIAWEAGVEPFEVSMELLVRWTPRLLAQGINPVTYLGQWGRELAVIRPSARARKEVPWVDPRWITPAPPEVLQPREQVRHAQRKCGPRQASTR